MNNQLSPETEAALRKLAREIGRARDLGEEALEELYGHLEDKTLGYLSGEDGITEADAVLLTREHFGLSGRAEDASDRSDVPVQSALFARRLSAIAIVDLTVGLVLSSIVAMVGLVLGPRLTPPGVQIKYDWSAILWLAIPGAVVVVLALCTGMLWLWRRKAGCNRQVWYVRWRLHALVIALGLLLAARSQQHLDFFAPAQFPFVFQDRYMMLNIAGLVALLLPALWAWCWVNWIAQTNRSIAALAAGGFAWYVLRLTTETSLSSVSYLLFIATVTVAYVFWDRLSAKYRDSQRGMPWVSN